MDFETITINRLAEVLCEANHFAFVNHGEYVLAITSPAYEILNLMDSEESQFVVIMSIRGYSDDNERFVYFVKEQEIDVVEHDIVVAGDDLYVTIIDAAGKKYPNLGMQNLTEQDMTLIGIFPIQPRYGNQFAELGIALYRLENE